MVGIPVKLLHEDIGHTVTCELKTGDIYDTMDPNSVKLRNSPERFPYLEIRGGFTVVKPEEFHTSE